MGTRSISTTELSVLAVWLAHDVPGAINLRTQLSPDLGLKASCDCGCGSVRIMPTQGESTEGWSGIFGIEASVLDDSGLSIGGMLLAIRDGLLHDIDVHSWSEPLAFPTLDRVSWRRRAQEAAE